MTRDNRKSFLIMTIISLLLVSLIHLYIILFLPLSPYGEWKEFFISKGMSFKEITAHLKKEGIISKVYAFDLLGRAVGITKKVRAGYYSLSPTMSMIEVLRTFKNGRIIEYSLTIPEGVTIEDIADILEKTGLANGQDFISIAHDRGFIKSLGLDADPELVSGLEGYLFPDTYLLPKGITPKEIAERMVNRFKEVITPEIENRAKELGFTIREVITLASIIEREAQIDSERPLVSAVYHNRLRKGIHLQADPTAIYGRKRLNEKITKKDLRSKSPYNTYRIRGLPPGPIANPGMKAIKAAIYPADVDYLFLVSKNDGTHHFSTTYSEHSEAVIKYQREKQEGG
jgi:UPF0755 protein